MSGTSRAVQLAFDVDDAVRDAVRTAAFQNHQSPSDQIRHLLGLPTPTRPLRPRLTVSLDDADCALLAARYGLPLDARRTIKERITEELIRFASGCGSAPGAAGREALTDSATPGGGRHG
jgi:hypothetical protein